jgi:hypothetical protein
MNGDQFQAGTEIFYYRHRIQTGFGVHPESYPVGIEALSTAEKRLERGIMAWSLL